MNGKIDLIITPPTLEDALQITHTNELVLLDKELYQGDLLLKKYGVSQDVIQSMEDIPPPRSNTYVLNMQKIAVEEGKVHLYTNYSTMRSQFALRRWAPVLAKREEEWEKRVGEYNPLEDPYVTRPDPSQYSPTSTLLFQYVLPIGVAMIIETVDEQILMEERGKVEIPGKYMPAPAGGCETRDWRVFPEPFRCIKGEAWEETALLPGKDYGDVALLGIVRDRIEAFNPTFTYHTKTPLELEKVIEQANNIAPEAGEHQRLFGAPINPEKLLAFCLENHEKIIGSGMGALLAFGQYKFGKEWLDSSVQELAKKNQNVILYGAGSSNSTFPLKAYDNGQ